MKDINKKAIKELEEENQFNFTFKQNRKISAICCIVLVIISFIVFLCASFKYVFIPYENDKIYYIITLFSILGTYWLPYLLHYIFLKRYFHEIEKFTYGKQLPLSENFKSDCYYFMMESSDPIVYICTSILALVFMTIYLTSL